MQMLARLKSHSNDISPTIRTIEGFTVIVEINEEKNDK